MKKEVDYFYEYFDVLFTVFEELYKNKVEQKRLTLISENSPNVLIKSSKYIPDKLVEKANRFSYLYKTLEDRFENIDIRLEVYEPKSSMMEVKPTIETKFSKKLLMVLYSVIFLITKVNPSHELKRLSVQIINLPYQKRLPTGASTSITPLNVNSGVTTSFIIKKEAEVIIFRREEVFKVLIHELIHSFNLVSHSIPKSENYLKQFFGVSQSSSLSTFESLTETYACLLNAFLVTKLVSDNSRNEIDVFRYLVDCEKQFALQQASKLLPYLELSTVKKKLYNACQDRQEQTHVVSYYVLKALNFINISLFISYLAKTRFNPKDSNDEYTELLIGFLKSNWLSTSKLSLLSGNKSLDKINKLLLKTRRDNKTLRMSCIDISAI